MPTVQFTDRSRVNLSAILSIIAHQDVLRISTPAIAGEFSIMGPHVHSLAGQFIVGKFPDKLGPGEVFPNLYLSADYTPWVEEIRRDPPTILRNIGRPVAFSPPKSTHEHLWFLLEGEKFAAFLPQSRFCMYKPNFERRILYFVFHREIFRITPRQNGYADPLTDLLDALDRTFPPCDRPGGPEVINTLSIYEARPILPRTTHPWAQQARHLVGAIDLVDPVAERAEWRDASAPPTDNMINNRQAFFRQKQVPEFPVLPPEPVKNIGPLAPKSRQNNIDFGRDFG